MKQKCQIFLLHKQWTDISLIPSFHPVCPTKTAIRYLYLTLVYMCNCTQPSTIKTSLVSVREKIGPFAMPDFIQNAPALPKTRSGNGSVLSLNQHPLPLISSSVTSTSSSSDSDLFREDHEANPAADRPQWEGPGWPFDPGWPKGRGGAF